MMRAAEETAELIRDTPAEALPWAEHAPLKPHEHVTLPWFVTPFRADDSHQLPIHVRHGYGHEQTSSFAEGLQVQQFRTGLHCTPIARSMDTQDIGRRKPHRTGFHLE